MKVTKVFQAEFDGVGFRIRVRGDSEDGRVNIYVDDPDYFTISKHLSVSVRTAREVAKALIAMADAMEA